MVSERRGWLQQLFDQYSGQRRLDGARCCSSSSPRSLKISNENARCRIPRPSWHCGLAQVAQPAVGVIHQDQGIRICHNTAININFALDFIHEKHPGFGAPPR